jgi:hypothetical protein
MPDPRIATPTPADVTGSYGREAEEWAAVHLGYKLRPWQRYALGRALEHRADGSLRWAHVLLTVSRQSGKTVLIPSVCGWRGASAELFGEPQKVLSIANLRSTAKLPWGVAERRAADWGGQVRLTTGEERIEWPSTDRERPEPDGVWLVQAATRNAGVGHSCSLVIVDEAWNVDREIVEAALAPSQLERIDPQIWLISTAGDGTSDLFSEHRALAIGQLSDPDTAEILILEWSSAPDAELDDRTAWRDASPHWNDRRLERLERLYRSTSATDFRRQYLNQWVSGSAHAWVSDLSWLRCRDDERELPGRALGSVAIESHLAGEPFGWVHAALEDATGEVVVRAGVCGTRRELWRELHAIAERHRGVRIIHPEGFRHHVPPMPGAGEIIRVTPSETFASYAATVTAIRAGGLAHAGQAVLTEQVLSAVAYTVTDRGSTLSSRASSGPIYLARALVWAVGHELRPNLAPRPLIVAG